MQIERTITWGEHQLTISTGYLACQAHAAVQVNLGDTVVLVTVVGGGPTHEVRDFFPLTVHYQERTYAAGKIPGGFLKREGRPSEQETLTSRLIDRPIRPLFADGFTREVQVVATVLSLDPDVSPDIPAIIGASAALTFSGLPFLGPIGAVRVGYRDGIYLLNPSLTELQSSDLDLVVAGTKDAVLMVESEARELSETVMLGAVVYGHEMMQQVIDLIQTMHAKLQPKPWSFDKAPLNEDLYQTIQQAHQEAILDAYCIKAKVLRKQRITELYQHILAQFETEIASGEQQAAEIMKVVHQLEKTLIRERILSSEPRIDGRDSKTVRDIHIQTSYLPRPHGSAVFTRGETQALVAVTLGTDRDSQIIDGLNGEQRDRFMLHYNFPAYSVGELGLPMGPKRREIGHGRLARRALSAVLPNEAEFPYVLRVVSEIMESNGSSSMATVCGASLALMDAGVPIKAPVAGVAMGLIKTDEQCTVLTDILGDEDHLGDMDFKVAGTETGVTALQMDIKIVGITEEIMKAALSQAHDARMHILEQMNRAIAAPRSQMSEYAPRVLTMKINAEKIKDVIGKGGSTIRQITEETGVTIDIQDDGMVKIFSTDEGSASQAETIIRRITSGVELGDVIEGKIVKLVDFGAFVSLLPGKEGLLHISEISHQRVKSVHDALEEGANIEVKVIEIDRQGRVKLSAKALLD